MAPKAAATLTLIASILSFGAGVLLALSIVQPGTERNWFYDYQALAAGFLAIVAAFITVRQMRVSDERFERRHGELVQLQRSGEKLLIDRMIDQVVANLANQIVELRDLIDNADDHTTQSWSLALLHNWVMDADGAVRRTEDMLHASQVTEAMDVMFPRLHAAYVRCLHKIHEFRGQRSGLNIAITRVHRAAGTQAAADYEQQARSAFLDHTELLQLLHEDLLEFCREAVEQKSAYEPHKT